MDDREDLAPDGPGASPGADATRGRRSERQRLPLAGQATARWPRSSRPRPVVGSPCTWKGRALRLMLARAVDTLNRVIGEQLTARPGGASPRLDELAQRLALTQSALEALMRILDDHDCARGG